MARDIMQQANKQEFTKTYLPKVSDGQSFPLPNVMLYGIYNAVWKLVPLKSGHIAICNAHTYSNHAVYIQWNCFLIGNYKGKEVNTGNDS